MPDPKKHQRNFFGFTGCNATACVASGSRPSPKISLHTFYENKNAHLQFIDGTCGGIRCSPGRTTTSTKGRSAIQGEWLLRHNGTARMVPNRWRQKLYAG